MSNANSFLKRRAVDIVFCIDGTGSMRPCIESVKRNAKRFYQDLEAKIENMGGHMDMLRIKVIIFRDYKSDGAEAMVESRFFELPDESQEFSAYMDSVKAHGGCGEDACGLEALYRAMKSDFVTGQNDRQLIVLFADTTAIPMQKRARYQYYPADMVDEEGLLNTWMCQQSHPSKLRDRNKRLVMFAPAESIYSEMSASYTRSVHIPIEIHNGMDEISFEEVMKIIAASAST